MTYEETIAYLYARTPSFERQGSAGYKPGLETAHALDALTGHGHRHYATLHVAGTNGKGSVCHLLAATLQQSGLKVGLYTSPHLVDFSERIRVNGQPVSHDYVCRWVERYRESIERCSPSFFEATTMMAFEYFRDSHVDIAVIEVGLGGRLDTTNIIHPCLSVITNISYDHTDLLGDTLAQIAAEKAGIIKRGVPVVVGEADEDEVARVIGEVAERQHAPLIWAQREQTPDIEVELEGNYQRRNARTALVAIDALRRRGYEITERDVRTAFAHFASMTGLMGRWQRWRERPLVISDTGHNPGAFRYTSRQLHDMDCRSLRIVFGMVSDKDVNMVLSMLPKRGIYYFCAANSHRALSSQELTSLARKQGLNGVAYSTVVAALRQALCDASEDDVVFVGGSTYVVGEAMTLLSQSA